MADLFGFDASVVEPSRGMEAIPAGRYVAVIAESVEMPTKAGNGHYLQLTFEITEGEHQKRLLWSRLNLDNPNPTAVDIARAELSAICRAVGVMQPQDSSDLHDIPLEITVKCRKRDDTGEIVNEIKGYAKKDPPAAAASPQPAPSDTPPWKRAT